MPGNRSDQRMRRIIMSLSSLYQDLSGVFDDDSAHTDSTNKPSTTMTTRSRTKNEGDSDAEATTGGGRFTGAGTSPSSLGKQKREDTSSPPQMPPKKTRRLRNSESLPRPSPPPKSSSKEQQPREKSEKEKENKDRARIETYLKKLEPVARKFPLRHIAAIQVLKKFTNEKWVFHMMARLLLPCYADAFFALKKLLQENDCDSSSVLEWWDRERETMTTKQIKDAVRKGDVTYRGDVYPGQKVRSWIKERLKIAKRKKTNAPEVMRNRYEDAWTALLNIYVWSGMREQEIGMFLSQVREGFEPRDPHQPLDLKWEKWLYDLNEIGMARSPVWIQELVDRVGRKFGDGAFFKKMLHIIQFELHHRFVQRLMKREELKREAQEAGEKVNAGGKDGEECGKASMEDGEVDEEDEVAKAIEQKSEEVKEVMACDWKTEKERDVLNESDESVKREERPRRKSGRDSERGA